MGIRCVVLYKVAENRRTRWWFILCIGYVRLYQAVAVAKVELLVACSGYQVSGAIPSCCMGKEGPGDGL